MKTPKFFLNLTDPGQTDYEGPPPDAWKLGDLGPRKFVPAILVNAPATTLPEVSPKAPSASPPRRYVCGSGEAGVRLNRAHVAELPDGMRINIPAGTVLGEGVDPHGVAPEDAKQRRGLEFAALEAAAKYVTCGVMGGASEHEDAETKELRRAVGDLLAFLGQGRDREETRR